MPKFPKRQADVDALALAMLYGYSSHFADFPSIDTFALISAHYAYTAAKNAWTEALAKAGVATEQKDAKLAVLVELMKADLKKSEVDVADAPEKLEYIGWGPKGIATAVEAPAQPTNMRTIAEGQGTVRLTWDSPACDSGGPVRNYIIERRQQPTGGEFGPWQIAGTAFNNEINLTGQPCRVQLEYRVKAVNAGGQSMPSNTVAVVL